MGACATDPTTEDDVREQGSDLGSTLDETRQRLTVASFALLHSSLSPFSSLRRYYFMVSDGRVVSDEQVRGVGRSDVRKRYGSCNGSARDCCTLPRGTMGEEHQSPHAHLKDVLGKSSSTVYAIALLASGQSSVITGTYAGQYIMQVDFLNMKMKKWLRNLMTQSIAITPSLIVSIINGSSGAGRLIIISSMVLSFELSFALLPLLKFSSSQTKMGPHKSLIYIIVVSWILGLLLVAINIYFLSTSFVSWLIDSNLPTVANVLISIIVFPLMAVYILAVIYLTFKETEVTFVDPFNSSHVNIESGGSFQVDGMSRSEVAPVREDRADIPLPD
ncbi:hypothetical protein ZIOFF_003721 [Zingiber officinale]|uniref:Uncharacterized protein n=1 Tax=Zingiber officinale TaxID=94328 RepID=A0A8J5HYX8_ZINOF|nr:hypothetical protein ZIOFF_003721 [Zingiber officinale]